MAEKRKSVIVTFKPKDQRPDSTVDKVDIVRGVITQVAQPTFFSATTLLSGVTRPPLPEHLIGYDINQYEAPIVAASLSDAEIDALRKNGNVALVEDDAPCYALGGPLQNLVIEDQPSVQSETVPAGVAQVKAPPAWGSSRGKGIRVAVVDTGIDFKHPDLQANYQGGVSFVPGAPTPMDDNSHGTHCAGTIAAAINGVGVVGVAPEAYLYAVKVLDKNGSGQFSWIIAGIDWCIQHGVHIVSMSLGGTGIGVSHEGVSNCRMLDQRLKRWTIESWMKGRQTLQAG